MVDVTIPAGQWRNVGWRWAGLPLEADLAVRPVGVTAEPDGWIAMTGWAPRPDGGRPETVHVAVQVRREALPPHLRIGSGSACVIPAGGWWQGRAEGDLLMDVYAVVPVVPDPQDAMGDDGALWVELHGQRVWPDGTRTDGVELVRLDALPPQLRLEAGGNRSWS